jgi:pimeloyl-ACP methyl ester carboxylesterase
VAGFGWDPVRPFLEERFTLHAVDRRGHGRSDPGPELTLAREVEDVIAVIESIGEPVHLVGHSMGAIPSLEAALGGAAVASLVLYEPYSTAFAAPPRGLVEGCVALIENGDCSAAAEVFMRQALELDGGVIAMLRAQPEWIDRVAAMRVLPHALRADAAYSFRPERLAVLESRPVALLAGSASPPWLRAGVETIHAALPTSTLVEMSGQKHTAMALAPHDFARRLLAVIEQPAATSHEAAADP